MKHAAVNLFTDDILLYIHGSNVHDVKRLMNEYLENVNEWLKMNRLKINVRITKYLQTGTVHEVLSSQLFMDGDEIEAIKEIKKYLVVVIDYKENFEKCKKIARKIEAKCRVYIHIQSVIAPHLFYYCAAIKPNSKNWKIHRIVL